MIPERGVARVLLIALAALPASIAQSAEKPDVPATTASPAAETKAETTIERFRVPVDLLSERMIGTASQAVRFDWRQQTAGVALLGSDLFELNTFNSARAGVSARTPLGGLMGELAVSRVFTWGSTASDQLALTPYRQAGRPSRFELDLNFGVPLAEGVVTARPAFFPVTQLVFSLEAGLRYRLYTQSFSGGSFTDVVKDLFAPKLSDREVAQFKRGELPGGMQVDRGRYDFLLGFALDLYFKSGGFLSPRIMVAPPILSGVTKSGIGSWLEFTLSVGWML